MTAESLVLFAGSVMAMAGDDERSRFHRIYERKYSTKKDAAQN